MVLEVGVSLALSEAFLFLDFKPAELTVLEPVVPELTELEFDCARVAPCRGASCSRHSIMSELTRSAS